MIHFGTVAYNALFRNHRDELITGLPRGNSFFDRRGNGDIQLFLQHFMEHYEATKDRGYISVPTGNHDTPPRLAEARTRAELECALLLLLTLPGIPFIYYGDEIALTHSHGLVSKEGGYERTGVRTPMPWDDSPNAGFSIAPASALYLPVDEPPAQTVAAAERDPASALHFVRRLIGWRKRHPALGSDGAFGTLFAEVGRYPFVFERCMDGERYWIAINPSSTAAVAAWSSEARSVEPWLAHEAKIALADGRVLAELGGAGYGVWKVQGPGGAGPA
jgi:maltose alpha-D-glucosyltransferase/alpha-amylase